MLVIKYLSKFKKFLIACLIIAQMSFVPMPVSASEIVFDNWEDMKNYIYVSMEQRQNVIRFRYTGEKDSYSEYKIKLENALKDVCMQDDYLERTWMEIKPRSFNTGDGVDTSLNVKYLTTREEEDYIDTELKKAVDEIITPDMSDFEKVNAINEYLIEKYEYDYSLESVSVYTALTSSLAVCQGYSMTAYKMFEYAGINSRIVVGTLDKAPHSWNKVKIDDKWYNIDITNNDSIIKNKYFLVNDKFLKKNKYVWNEDNYPKATDKL